jgi:hypothetical protein
MKCVGAPRGGTSSSCTAAPPRQVRLRNEFRWRCGTPAEPSIAASAAGPPGVSCAKNGVADSSMPGPAFDGKTTGGACAQAQA